jgi:hypothetical protein
MEWRAFGSGIVKRLIAGAGFSHGGSKNPKHMTWGQKREVIGIVKHQVHKQDQLTVAY